LFGENPAKLLLVLEDDGLERVGPDVVFRGTHGLERHLLAAVNGTNRVNEVRVVVGKTVLDVERFEKADSLLGRGNLRHAQHFVSRDLIVASGGHKPGPGVNSLFEQRAERRLLRVVYHTRRHLDVELLSDLAESGSPF